jgi:hypothetical protein
MKGRKSMRYRKKGFRRTRKQKAGVTSNYTKPNTSSSSVSNTSSPPNTSSSSSVQNVNNKKQYGSITSAITGSIKASTKAWNMPAAIAAMNHKINALLVHNKVNYVFSNGYNARDYDLRTAEATSENDGRGVLIPGSKRGVITGFQSKIFNKGTDIYDSSKNKGKM